MTLAKRLTRKLSLNRRDWVLLVLLAGSALFAWNQSRSIRALQQEKRNMRETFTSRMLSDGSVRAGQKILEQGDLNQMARKLFRQMDDLKREVKRGQVESVTQIRLALDSSRETRVEIEPVEVSTPDIPEEWEGHGAWVANSTAWIRDDWFQVKLSVPSFDVLETKRAPIELDLVESEQDDRRELFVVARNGWTQETINQVDIQRTLVQQDVFKPYFSVGVGLFNTSGMLEITRHTGRSAAWSGLIGYDVQEKGFSFGIVRRQALRWPWR